MSIDNNQNNSRLPRWMKMQRASGPEYIRVKKLVERNQLHTICTSGNCPNIGECWNAGTATFMILGEICTRACKFCGTITGKPLKPDIEEPKRLADSIKLLNLKHCVITSVDRDDLPDGGSNIWASTIREIKVANPGITIEALIPDFDGNRDDILRIVEANPDVISHNLETVERVTPLVRSRAKYRRSLEVIRIISESGIRSKSGIMVGLGESEDEVYKTMDDLIEVGCEIFTIGQYLRPSHSHMEVVEYVTPEQFKRYEEAGLSKGFRFVESNPLVRSSFHAEKHIGG
jgi:lipoic acid synthetase